MKLKSFALFLFVVLIWLPVNSSRASEGTRDANKFAQRLDGLVPKLLQENLVPGTAVALIQNGEVVFKKGYGYSDLEKSSRLHLKRVSTLALFPRQWPPGASCAWLKKATLNWIRR